MVLDSFLFLFFFAYLIGSMNFKSLEEKTRSQSSSGLILGFDFIKGAFTVLLAELLMGSSIAMVLSGIFVICGHSKPLFKDSDRRKSICPALGSLLVISPVVFFLTSSLATFTLLLTGYILSIPVVMGLTLPFAFWYFKRYDLYVIYGLILTTFLIYQFIPDIERWINGDRKKTSKRRFIEDLYNLQKNDGICAKQLLFSRIILIVGILGLSALLFLNRYVYKGFGMQVDVVRKGNPALPYVALTFDDGPDPIYTPLILDVLKEYDVKATFFLVGKKVKTYPDIVKRIVNEGHEVGNHTYSHKNLFGLQKEKIYDEIIKAEEAIIEATGEKPHLFRPPRGLYQQVVMDILSDRQYTMVLWTYSSRDWMEVSSRKVRDYVINNLTGGDILLFHDSGSIIASQGGNRYNTVTALPIIIEEIKKRGYFPVTITELTILAGLTGSEEINNP